MDVLSKDMFLFYILRVLTIQIGSSPKFIESKGRPNAFVTGFENGVLLIQRSKAPSNMMDPSVVQFMADGNGNSLIKFGNHKFLCSHPQKNHIGMCNTGEIKNSQWKIEKLKMNVYLIKQKGQCLTAILTPGRKMKKYRMKLQNCQKNFKWNIRDAIADQYTSDEGDESSSLNPENKEATIMDQLAEIDDIATSAHCKYKDLKDEIIQPDPVNESEKMKSNLNKHSTPFIYKDDNKYDKNVLMEDHHTGLVHNEDVNCDQPDYAFGLGESFYNVYDFLNRKIPISTIPKGKSQEPCSAHDILDDHHER